MSAMVMLHSSAMYSHCKLIVNLARWMDSNWDTKCQRKWQGHGVVAIKERSQKICASKYPFWYQIYTYQYLRKKSHAISIIPRNFGIWLLSFASVATYVKVCYWRNYMQNCLCGRQGNNESVLFQHNIALWWDRITSTCHLNCHVLADQIMSYIN